MRTVAIVVVCSLLLPHPAAARQAVGDWNAVRGLAPGADIRVTLKSGAVYHGELIGTTAESMSLVSDERGFPGRARRQRELRREDVLEVRRFNKAGSALAGAGIGAAAGAGIGLAVDFKARSNEDRGLATVVFVLLGTLLGWAVGKHTTLIKGATVYRAS